MTSVAALIARNISDRARNIDLSLAGGGAPVKVGRLVGIGDWRLVIGDRFPYVVSGFSRTKMWCPALAGPEM